MKCFYKELDRRKKYLITKLQNEVAALGDSWFREEITDQQQNIRIKQLDQRIADFQGGVIQKSVKEIKLKEKQQNF